MTALVIISDASPLLTFLASGNEDLLLAAVEAADAVLTAPAVVIGEVYRKAEQKELLAPAATRLDYLRRTDRIRVLDPTPGPELTPAVNAVQVYMPSSGPASSKNLGELMAMAHGRVLEGQGHQVKLLIEENTAQDIANRKLGLRVINTASILAKCASLGLIADRGEMRKLWERLRPYDLSLLPWEMVDRLRQRELYRHPDEPAT